MGTAQSFYFEPGTHSRSTCQSFCPAMSLLQTTQLCVLAVLSVPGAQLHVCTSCVVGPSYIYVLAVLWGPVTRMY